VRLTRAPSEQAPLFHPFVPALGPLEHKLFRLSQQLTGTPMDADVVERLAALAVEDWRANQASERQLRWALSLSILADILWAGGTVHALDSALHVAWPDWSTEEGTRGLRRALERLRGEMRYGRVSTSVVAALPSSISPEQLLLLVDEGEFCLQEAEGVHALGAAYGEIFSAARRYWTMPHRDREGRNRRFVMTVNHPTLDHPLPAGILEVGDASPMAAERDAILGLTAPALSEWLTTPGKAAARQAKLEERIRGFHAALRPISGLRIRRSEFEAQYEMIPNLEEAALGRSRTEEDHSEKKRTAYLARLLRALRAVGAMRSCQILRGDDLSALARLTRDLTVPRVTLEMTLCGALPPFSNALIGKLVVAFAGDSRIRAICGGEPGRILASVFDLSAVRPLLQTGGAVLLTTKGLFPHHSAQYTRAELPRRYTDLRVPVRKIGETTGITASLMSKRTYRLARMFLDLPHQRRVVAGVFGSGGSKRQRRIEAAVSALGLPEGIIHPRLQRPIYAAELALNLREVSILNERPRWAVSTSRPHAYAQEARELWRSHWLAAAQRRVRAQHGLVAGIREFIELSISDASD